MADLARPNVAVVAASASLSFARTLAPGGAMNATVHFVRTLFAGADDALVELRLKQKGRPGMRQEFVSVSDPLRCAGRVLELAHEGDCYIGVLPRKRMERQSGGKDATVTGRVVWADCDTTESALAVDDFDPQPSVVVRSGSGGCHAYWLLDSWTTPDVIERVNRQIAVELGADAKATDAARILRPPGTFNHKHDPPKLVELSLFSPARRSLAALVSNVPAPTIEPTHSTRTFNAGALAEIATEDYFAVLCNVESGPHRTVCCPLPDHDDKTPSCHLYDNGWYCFGCGRGGTVYDLASHLWGIGTRGEEFCELDQRLRRELGVAA